MPFTQFTARDLSNNFGIKFQAEHLFDNIKLPNTIPSPWLVETIERGKRIGFSSEKSRSERLVAPILTELSIINNEAFTIYSGMNINANEQLGLNGECDFMLSFSRIQDFVIAPIFSITEAKKQDIEQGTIQCAAQLIAADILNQKDNYPFKTLFGCSTTGTEWRFLKLEGKKITLDINRYFLTDLTKLLSLLQYIVLEANTEFSSFKQ